MMMRGGRVSERAELYLALPATCANSCLFPRFLVSSRSFEDRTKKDRNLSLSLPLSLSLSLSLLENLSRDLLFMIVNR